jgi:hypothetical protein
LRVSCGFSEDVWWKWRVLWFRVAHLPVVLEMESSDVQSQRMLSRLKNDLLMDFFEVLGRIEPEFNVLVFVYSKG